jgi:hypothetical protein
MFIVFGDRSYRSEELNNYSGAMTIRKKTMAEDDGGK